VPLDPSAEREFRDILRSFRAAHTGAVIPSAQGKALEAWILLKLASTASMMPSWDVTLRQGDNTLLPPGASFQLASQHTSIKPSSLSSPGFINLRHTKNPALEFELHCSLQWVGRSGARHEVDISLVPATIAQALRLNGGGYPHGLPVAALECKDKTTIGTLDETRQSIARMFDLAFVTRPAPGWSCRIYENRTGVAWGSRSSQYVAFFAKGVFGIVREGAVQAGAQSLAKHYHVEQFTSVYSNPGTISSLQARFRGMLYRASRL
jgi:hypothetical protein